MFKPNEFKIKVIERLCTASSGDRERMKTGLVLLFFFFWWGGLVSKEFFSGAVAFAQISGQIVSR